MDFNVQQTMSATRQRVNKTKGFSYDDPSHTYLFNGIKLKSATSLISEHYGSFNSMAISNRVAQANIRKGTGITDAVQVRKYWSLKGKRASSLGTTGHDFCLMYWMDRSTQPVTRLDRNAKKLMDKIFENFEIIRMEVPKANEEFLIGYTVDILMRHLSTGEIYLGDFKYSQAFTKEQYKELKGRLPKKIKGIFDGLRDVGYDKGQIQMNMYKKFLAGEGIKVAKCVLFHIDGLLPNEESYYGTKGYQMYPVMDLSSQIEQMLEPHRNPNVQNIMDNDILNVL